MWKVAPLRSSHLHRGVCVLKPESCKGCPLYDNGKGFVPDELRPNADFMVIRQNPGEDEEKQGRPSVGKSGQELDNRYLPLTGRKRGKDVSVANVLKCRWRKGKTKTNDLPPEPMLSKATTHCMQAHLVIPPGVRLIMAEGTLAAHAIGNIQGSIYDWRGFLSPNQFKGRDVLVTLHIAGLYREPRMIIPCKHDWTKVQRYLKGQWPEPIPSRVITTTETPEYREIMELLRSDNTGIISCDTEYADNGQYIILDLVGLCARRGTTGEVVGVQVPYTESESEFRTVFRNDIRWLFTHKPVMFYNIMADIRALKGYLGLYPQDYCRLEDPMLIHSCLFSEWQHSLKFTESMHGRHRKMKHLSKEDPLLYNWGDCLSQLYVFEDLEPEILKEPDMYHNIYRNQLIPLAEPRIHAKEHGIRLDQEFLAGEYARMVPDIEEAQRVAREYTGYDINVGSDDQLDSWFRNVEPDSLELTEKQQKKKLSFNEDSVSKYRRLYLDYDPEEEKDGITQAALREHIDRGGHPLLEARAAYQSQNTLRTHYLNPLLRKQGGKPQSIHDVLPNPSQFRETVYPDQNIHSQATGRWSTVEPPLPTLPPRLRPMVIPWKGWCIITFDWDQIELRISAHLANDEPTLAAFRNKFDVHTMNACDCFEYPYPPDLTNPHGTGANIEWAARLGWEGKEDRRRVFAKRFVYRIMYRGDPKYAGDIPGVQSLGLTPSRLVDASRAYLRKHPALPVYWQTVDAQTLSTRKVYTFMGRRRLLAGSIRRAAGGVPEICREGCNQPMQGGVSDIFNTTVLKIWNRTRDLNSRWLYGSHDSQKWACPEKHVDEMKSRMDEILNETWKIYGRELYLPATFDEVKYG